MKVHVQKEKANNPKSNQTMSEEEKSNVLGTWNANSNTSHVYRDICKLVMERFMKVSMFALSETEIYELIQQEELHEYIIDQTNIFMESSPTKGYIDSWTQAHKLGFSSYVGIDEDVLNAHICKWYNKLVYRPLFVKYQK
jgi:hypothetical protein